MIESMGVSMNFAINGQQFILDRQGKILLLYMIAEGVQEMIASYVIDAIDETAVAQDIASKIVSIIALPHMILSSDKSLFLFYITIVNAVNFFYMEEVAHSRASTNVP